MLGWVQMRGSRDMCPLVHRWRNIRLGERTPWNGSDQGNTLRGIVMSVLFEPFNLNKNGYFERTFFMNNAALNGLLSLWFVQPGGVDGAKVE